MIGVIKVIRIIRIVRVVRIIRVISRHIMIWVFRVIRYLWLLGLFLSV
jgi:hypothetical protein